MSFPKTLTLAGREGVTPVLLHRRSQSLDHSLAIVRNPLVAFIQPSLVAEGREVVERGEFWVKDET